jgi:hypothetical protein
MAGIEVDPSFISNMIAILNLTSSRGAFKPEEYKTIGAFYEQLVALVPKPEQPPSEDPPKEI